MPWKLRITTLMVLPVLILSFQNCSDFSLQDQILYEQALMESRTALDAEVIPALLNSSTLRRWYKTSDNGYVNSSISGNQFSIVVALPRTSTGKVVYLNTAADTEEGSITIASGKIQAIRHNSIGTAYDEVLEADLPLSGTDMVIAAAFGVGKGEISLLVNGKVQQSAVVATGTPGDFTSATRVLNTAGTLGEFMVFVGESATSATNGKLGIAELNVMSRYLADNLSIPNVIFDPVVVGGTTGGGGVTVDDTRFLAAKAILDSKCLSCHNGSQTPNFSNYTEAKAIANGDVAKGNLAGSKLYYRLIGSAGAGSKTMPLGGSITAGEVQAVADWITNIP